MQQQLLFIFKDEIRTKHLLFYTDKQSSMSFVSAPSTLFHQSPDFIPRNGYHQWSHLAVSLSWSTIVQLAQHADLQLLLLQGHLDRNHSEHLALDSPPSSLTLSPSHSVVCFIISAKEVMFSVQSACLSVSRISQKLLKLFGGGVEPSGVFTGLVSISVQFSEDTNTNLEQIWTCFHNCSPGCSTWHFKYHQYVSHSVTSCFSWCFLMPYSPDGLNMRAVGRWWRDALYSVPYLVFMSVFWLSACISPHFPMQTILFASPLIFASQIYMAMCSVWKKSCPCLRYGTENNESNWRGSEWIDKFA